MVLQAPHRLDTQEESGTSVMGCCGGRLDEGVPHVFEPFYRAGREGEGTGLGLSIATRIAEAMGASLEAESVPGEGSVFRLRVDLPLASVSTELRPRSRF